MNLSWNINNNDSRLSLLKKRLIQISDNRKIDSASGNKITDKTKMDTTVDPSMVKDIVSKAIKTGIDPYTALAMAHQESGFGKSEAGPNNPFHISALYDDDFNFSDADKKGQVQMFMDMFKKKQELAQRLGKKDEASIIQAWNGYGKISKKSEDDTSKYYGIDVSKEPLDMNKNPVYGKRVVDIRDNVIKQNPELVNLVENTIKEQPIQIPFMNKNETPILSNQSSLMNILRSK